MVEKPRTRSVIDENGKENLLSSRNLSKSKAVKVNFCKEKRVIFTRALWKPKTRNQVAHGTLYGSTSIARVYVVKHKEL